MVRSGAISGDKANAWKKKLADENRVASSRILADKGDVGAMWFLYRCYNDGTHGISKDDALAFKWCQRAAALDHTKAQVRCGHRYVQGKGTVQNIARGMYMIGRASERSAYACFLLGSGHQKKSLGLDQDYAEATKWYKKALNSTEDPCSTTTVKDMEKWIAEHSN
jgi:TPR repeat protein